MISKFKAAILLIAFCLPLTNACHSQNSTNQTAGVQVVDAGGQPITIRDSSRIVSVGTAITETICALGACARLVGVDSASGEYIKEASGVPKVGPRTTLSAEGIISLEPTLVMLNSDSGPPQIVVQLKSAGLTVLVLSANYTLDMGRAPHLKGAEKKRDYEIARAALEVVEANHLEDRLYPTLSGGERQRVHLARVLAQIWEPANHRARYLLLDEPTSSLDLAHQHSALNVARKFARDGVGVIVILHDLNLAAQYADRVVMMKDGKVTHSGAPSAVLTSDTIRETFDVPVIVTQHPVLQCPLVVTEAGSYQRSSKTE